jgi:Isochorismatase family
MADDFEDHCWKDIVPADVLDIYSHYVRKTFVGPSPALLAIDLYELAYQGGAKPVAELHKTYASSCGEHAYAAIEPTKRLFAAARAAGVPVFYTTQDTRPDCLPALIKPTRRQNAARDPALYAIRPEFKPQAGDVVITKQRASGFYGTPLMAHLTGPRHQDDHRLRREHVGLRARVSGRRLFQRLPRGSGRGVLLRPQHALAQGQPVRPASQIRRRDACRRGGGASRRPVRTQGELT